MTLLRYPLNPKKNLKNPVPEYRIVSPRTKTTGLGKIEI